MPIYIHEHVQQIKDLYFDVLSKKESYKSVVAFLQDCADASYQNYKDAKSDFTIEFSQFHPQCRNLPASEIVASIWTIDDFRLTLARAYTFADWEQVVQRDAQFDPLFEVAVDWLLAGEFKRLIQLINSKPYILTRTSPFGHQAGLIHYCGSNGVEIWRQVVPSNLPQMMDYLIENGADPKQENNIYNMNSSLQGLIESSAHPSAAGIESALLDILK